VEREELVKKMRARVETCRRLANSTTDQRAAETLKQIAEEGEVDIERLLPRAERASACNAAFHP
jgi:hypothetical protein